MSSDRPTEGVINLQGSDYATYKHVLAKAHEKGLQGIVTRLLEFPREDNGLVAVCEATVTMKDGSVFTDIGDASAKNVTPRISTALIRMASTRAKGRALRDAVNIGEALKEEMPDCDDEGTPGERPQARANSNGNGHPGRQSQAQRQAENAQAAPAAHASAEAQRTGSDAVGCVATGCKTHITPRQAEILKAKGAPPQCKEHWEEWQLGGRKHVPEEIANEWPAPVQQAA